MHRKLRTRAGQAELPRPVRPPTLRKRAVWEAGHQRHHLGPALRQIARALGRARRTVRRYRAADQPPVEPARRPWPTQLTPYIEYRAERWTQGGQNAPQLYDQLVPRGYRGAESMVRVAVRPWRTRQEGSPPALPPAQRSRLMRPLAGRLTEAE